MENAISHFKISKCFCLYYIEEKGNLCRIKPSLILYDMTITRTFVDKKIINMYNNKSR